MGGIGTTAGTGWRWISQETGGGLVRGVVVEARGSVSWVAVGELGYSGADVARYLGVTNSCVTRFVASGIKADVDDLIRKL